jgi:pectate lyase
MAERGAFARRAARLCVTMAVVAVIVVVPLPPASATTTTIVASADAFVAASAPSANKGAVAVLRINDDVKRSYLRFDLTGLPSNEAITGATLRLFATSAPKCASGLEVFVSASEAWSETSIRWRGQPGVSGARVGALGAWGSARYIDVDVSAALPLAGPTATFVVRHSPGCTPTGDATFQSREGSNPPQLTVVTGGATSPQCADSLDNDGDGFIDYPADRGCTSASDDDEADATTAMPAFPGAEGFGANAVGGRYGRVIEVMTLADAGPGSLREALEAPGPRIVVFRIGGTIETQSPITVDDPYLTVAGQTAPGGGIALRASPDYKQGSLIVRTHDVVIRGLRLRPGASTELSDGRRGLFIAGGAYNIVVDHCSISWATDENVALVDGAHDITIQWSIISEGLSHSTSVSAEHSKGFSVSGKSYGSTERTRDVSIHHDLFAHNRDRSPMNASWGLVDVVNNVIYDYGMRAIIARDVQTNVPMNVVGNYVKAGPDSSLDAYEVFVGETGTSPAGAQLFVKGNIGPHRAADSDPEEAVVAPDDRTYIVANAFPAPPISTTSATIAYGDVLRLAGATAPQRDAVDERLITDVSDGTGHIIDDPQDVGGWPSLAEGSPPPDSDHDGMPDDWEVARGLQPSVDDSAGDRDGDGYTNIEEYINSILSS